MSNTESHNISSTTTQPHALRILLVDDHVDTLNAMARLLTLHGHAVQTAATARAALESADGQPFDLLLCDMDLPDGSGLDVMRHLRKLGPMRGIAITGFSDSSDERSSREAGFCAHMVKPVDFINLLETIRKVT